MRFRVIACQVLARELNSVRSKQSIDMEILPMGLHDLGASMRPRLQERIDASDHDGYDAILLGYALCGRGTEGIKAGETQLVIPRAHDCIGLLMGSRQRYEDYFHTHPGTYYRSPGWIENQVEGSSLEPATVAANRLSGERLTRDELVTRYGSENGNYLFHEFSAYRKRYTGLTYISTGDQLEDQFRNRAIAEAEKEGWVFQEIEGSLTLLERLVNGEWDAADFLVVPPGAALRVTLGTSIVEAT